MRSLNEILKLWETTPTPFFPRPGGICHAANARGVNKIVQYPYRDFGWLESGIRYRHDIVEGTP
jgi:hypothetical protein